MSPAGRPSANKRLKEQKRREKQARKDERRAQRKAEREQTPKSERGPDHDIAHIVPGPQPLPWETEE